MTPLVTTDSKFRDLQYIWQKRIQFSGQETTHLDFEARVHHSASFHSSPVNVTDWYNSLAEPNPLPSQIVSPRVAYHDW